MKKLALVTVLATAGFTGFAQRSAVKTDTISTPTIQCEKCKVRLQQYLDRIDGVIQVKVNYQKKDATQRNVIVKYYTDRTNVEMLKASIANAGYDAAEIGANPESYMRLPQCCKKPKN